MYVPSRKTTPAERPGAHRQSAVLLTGVIPSMARASELKRGNVVQHDGKTWSIAAVERSAPTGRGGNTTYRFQLYSIPGQIKLDLSLRADDLLTEVELSKRQASFSYMEGEDFVFLDIDDYTPYTLSPTQVGDLPLFMTDTLGPVYIQLIDDAPVGLQLPQTVELTIIDTPPYLKGASATGRAKPAKLETGLEVQVPEYLSNGERIRISTETREYNGRAD